MRIPCLRLEDCSRIYNDTLSEVNNFKPQKQSSWYFHAHALVRLGKLAYAIGHPLLECRESFRNAVGAFRELFSLRGTSFSIRTTYEDGKPSREEKVFDDGFTSVDSFEGALTCLVVYDIANARELVALAGHSPNAEVVYPRSEVCTSNEQTLSHALNAVLTEEFDLALRETQKIIVRRGNKMEKQIATTIAAIAGNGDVLTELDAIIFYHEKAAKQTVNSFNTTYYLCLPALGLSSLAVQLGRCKLTDLDAERMYAPAALLQEL